MNTLREQMSSDRIAFKRPVISGLGATRTLNDGESGSLIVLDRAAGTIITLPTVVGGAIPGTWFEFYVTVSVTSNNHKIITGAGTELLIGGVISDDTDSSNAVAIFDANGTSHIAITMNGTTTGGLKGTRIRLTNLDATKWLIEGSNLGNGTVATPFTTS